VGRMKNQKIVIVESWCSGRVILIISVLIAIAISVVVYDKIAEPTYYVVTSGD
jgi:hypothetical protein